MMNSISSVTPDDSCLDSFDQNPEVQDFISISPDLPDRSFSKIKTFLIESLPASFVGSAEIEKGHERCGRPKVFIDPECPSVLRFGYRLVDVAIGQTGISHEGDHILNLSRQWHQRFLAVLSTFGPNVIVRLRYAFSPEAKMIKTTLVFEYKGTQEDGKTVRIQEIQDAFGDFFSQSNGVRKSVFQFSPLLDGNDMNNFPAFIPGSMVRLLPSPRIVELGSCRTVGFGMQAMDVCKNLELPQCLNYNDQIDYFLDTLTRQKSETALEIFVQSVHLGQDTIGYLKEVSRTVTNAIGLDDDIRLNANSTIRKLMNSPNQCFHIEVLLAQESSLISRNLLVASSSCFVDMDGNVQEQMTDYWGIMLPGTSESNVLVNWSGLYTLENCLEVFKLPTTNTSGMSGINTTNLLNRYLPENLSETGPIVGSRSIGGMEIPIRIETAGLRKHCYILGQTGTGKSTVLFSMIMERIYAGKGVCVIDPHGDLVKTVLANIPQSRLVDTIQLNPSDPTNEIRINLLEYSKHLTLEKSFLIDELFNFFREEYDPKTTMGPIFELFMKNSLLLLMNDPDDIGSIDQLIDVFQNETFREMLLSKCRNKEVVDFWINTAHKLTGDYNLVNMTPYIVSKLNQLLINDFIRPIISTRTSNIQFREIIDTGKILLVSLSMGRIGRIGVRILGSIILSRIMNAAYSREDIPEGDRTDFLLLVDEFQNFLSNAVLRGISEVRKYGLSIVLANQNLGQLDPAMLGSVLGNVGNTLFFRPGISDAQYLNPYFYPYLTTESMLTLPNYQFVARLQVSGAPSLPFILETIQPDKVIGILRGT